MANYRKIWKDCNGLIPKDEQGRSYEIHHIDGNRRNNCIENLVCISIQEHYDIHYRQGDEIACHAIKLRMKTGSLKGWHHTKEMKKKFSDTRKGRKHSIEAKEKIRESRTGIKHSAKTKGKISKSHKTPVMHLESGVVYESSKAAAIVNRVSSSTIVYQIKQGVFKVLTKGEYSILKQDTIKLEQVYVKQKGGDTQKKRILHIPTGEIYESAALAAKKFGWFPNNIGYYIKKGIFKYI